MISVEVRGVILLTDLEEFVRDHRPHGTLTGDVTGLTMEVIKWQQGFRAD